MITITQLLLKKKPVTAEQTFRLRFAAGAPVPEIRLSERGLMGNVLIRGENFGGRNHALVALCGEVTQAGFGVIYVTEGLVPALATQLREHARAAFGPTRYHALNLAAERNGRQKVSRQGVSMLQFHPHHAPSSVDEVGRRLLGILDWLEGSDIEQPMLLILENYASYCKAFAVDLLARANLANCAVILTAPGSDPRVGFVPDIEAGVYERCATVLDLNRRRAGRTAEAPDV